jgi:hypothetical protein
MSSRLLESEDVATNQGQMQVMLQYVRCARETFVDYTCLSAFPWFRFIDSISLRPTCHQPGVSNMSLESFAVRRKQRGGGRSYSRVFPDTTILSRKILVGIVWKTAARARSCLDVKLKAKMDLRSTIPCVRWSLWKDGIPAIFIPRLSYVGCKMSFEDLTGLRDSCFLSILACGIRGVCKQWLAHERWLGFANDDSAHDVAPRYFGKCFGCF